MIINIIKKKLFNDEKDKVVIKNIILSFGIKGLALLLALIKMPMYLKFFDNQEILGIWFTLLSMLTWIFNFDLGIGNGLRNKLVKHIEKNNNIEIKKYVSSAYFSIFIVVIIIGVVGSIIIPLVDWANFFNINSNVINNSCFEKVILVILFGLLIQFLLKLVNSIFYAFQKAYIPGLLNFISELALLIVIIFLDNTYAIDLKFKIIAVAYSLCMVIPLFVANIIMFFTKLKDSKPSIKFFSKKYAKSILYIGGLFFWVQIMYMLIVNTNEYLITWFVGPKYVVDYQIYNKIFSLIGTLFTLFLTPMWSMITKAIVSKDYVWVKKLYNRLKRITLIVIIFEILLIPFFQIILNIWLGNNTINVNYMYTLLFAILGSLLIWNGVISTIVNGMGKLKVQFICLTAGVILNIPLAYIFCNVLNSWIGVVIANILSFIPYCIIQPIYIEKYLKE